MRRIGLAVVLALALALEPLASDAQQAANIPRIGFLSPSSLSQPRTTRYFQAFRQGLRELGYVQGQNVAIEARWAEGKFDRLPGLAAELVRLRLTVIVTYGEPAVRAAKQATTTIPIVMAATVDPVMMGFVANLAHPGGNITGISTMQPELVEKQLELLKEAIPTLSLVAVLGNPTHETGNALQMRHAEGTARALGLRLQPLKVRGPSEIEGAFAAMAAERAGALIILVDTMLFDQQSRVVDLAARQRLPMVWPQIDQAEVGGLMAYGPSVSDRFRRAATYVDKILKGAKPGDLPVEQPTKFELLINLKSAKALGLTLSPSILARADEVMP